jgi:heme oxygenase
MQQLPTALLRLNLATHPLHASADRHWVELVAGKQVPTRREYMYALVKTYGFEAPLEAALRYTPGFTELVGTGRDRSGLLAQDLLRLGLTPGQVACTPQLVIAPFAGVAEALGWLYVHERATIKHERVRVELERRAPAFSGATAYLGAYAGAIGVRLDELGRLLDSYATEPAITERMLEAASDAFTALLGWLDATDAAGFTRARSEAR